MNTANSQVGLVLYEIERQAKELRIVIAGSRTFDDMRYMRECLDEALSGVNAVVLSGAAMGADQMGERYAVARGWKVERYPADWNRFGNSAGMIRNKEMLDKCDAVVVFWDGKSRGTANMIEIARGANKLLDVFTFNTDSDFPF